MRRFDLSAYWKRRQARIEAALEAALPPAGCAPPALHRAMRYAVFSGGKRLRPLLCLAAAEAVGGSWRQARAPAVALELLHTYTLIHDDLPCMDDDALRRGKPTCHIVFGEANAVLAGDALQALAFAWVARAPAGARYSAAARVAELAAAAGSRGVVGGQVADLAAKGGAPGPRAVRYIHQHKTADLFRAALRLGAMAGEGRPTAVRALGRYGEQLGLAFQIADDLRDAAPVGKTGRPKDMSCVPVYGLAGARRRARRRIAAALAALSALPARRAAPLAAMARWVLERADAAPAARRG